jgi:aminoglycoside 3-N-acetyltransferase I
MTRVFGAAFGEPQAYGKRPLRPAYVREQLGKEHVIVVVGESAGEVAGGLVAYVLDKLDDERREVYLYDLAVAEPHRRRGVAKGAIAELQRIAAGLGAGVIFVQADTEDAPAIALYESLATRITAYHFELDVAHDPGTPG